MRWSGGETRTAIDAELIAAGELPRSEPTSTPLNAPSNAQQTIERMKDMKDLISSTHENIKSPGIDHRQRRCRWSDTAVPFDRGLKLIEKPL